jgi:uncharacterized protein (UPF0332 family)
MFEVYRNSFNNRQESDYSISETSSFDISEIKKSIEDADYFIKTTIDYLGITDK